MILSTDSANQKNETKEQVSPTRPVLPPEILSRINKRIAHSKASAAHSKTQERKRKSSQEASPQHYYPASLLGLPQLVRLQIWQYLRLDELGALACTSRDLREDRNDQLDPMRVAVIEMDGRENLHSRLMQSALLRQTKYPVRVHVVENFSLYSSIKPQLTFMTIFNAPRNIEPFRAVTELDLLEFPNPDWYKLERLFPSLQKICLSPLDDTEDMMKLEKFYILNQLPIRQLVWRHAAWNSAGQSDCVRYRFDTNSTLEDIDLTGSFLPIVMAQPSSSGNNDVYVEDRYVPDNEVQLLPWFRDCKLKRVRVKDVKMGHLGEPSQSMLIQFVSDHSATLKLFESGLSKENMAILRKKYNSIVFL